MMGPLQKQHGRYLIFLMIGSQLSWGQVLKPDRTIRYAGRMDYDSYFGFYPTLSASLAIDSLREFTAYASYYTNPAFFGLEAGVSVGFSTARRNWSVTPGVGVVSGSLFVSEQPFTTAEGFVGTLTIQHEGPLGFIQGYSGYYGAWKRLTPWTYDFLFCSIQAGRYVSKYWRLGLVYEQLANVRLPRNRFDTTEFSVPRLGLATEVYLPNGFTAQAMGGWTRNDNQRLFFRIGISRSL